MAAAFAAIKQRKALRNKQMAWLLENFTEPNYLPDCTNNMASLSDTFQTSDEVDKDFEGYNPCGITMALINYNPTTTKATEMSYYGVATFMRNVQSYLPKKLRSIGTKGIWNPRSFEPQNSTPDPDTVELLEQMIDFIMGMKSRIVDDLTCKYIVGGKPQMLEVLKRRAKATWTERIETQNENHDTVDGGFKLNINFKELKPDEGN